MKCCKSYERMRVVHCPLLPKYHSRHTQGNFHLEAHFYSSVPLFTESVTQFVKKGICYMLGFLIF